MKFYIPTSSLNMDNLLQSECILPISHYVQRLSGYKLYEQIDESKKDKLKEEIINIYNRFSGKNVKEINICREYKLN